VHPYVDEAKFQLKFPDYVWDLAKSNLVQLGYMVVGLVLVSSQFLLLFKLPQNETLATKVMEIIISI